MRYAVLAAAFAELLLVGSAAASLSLPLGLGIPDRPPPPDDGDDDFVVDILSGVARRAEAPISATAGYFQQLIDHKNPSLGTFTQRYWWNADHYAGPGSPIVLNAPGESNADGYQGYTTNRTLPGLFAQATGGAAIVLEHRYWGGSSPYLNLTAETLQYLDLDNAIADLIYFAEQVSLPFDPTGSSKPDKAPWVLSGCSYPGALTAWTNALAPGTFWAYHCSSAVVEAISTLWQYFSPIEQAMPRNCSADMRRVIKHVDQVLSNGTAEKRQRLKTLFGFGDLKHDDDFASALTNPLGLWQGTQFYTGYTALNRMCDYIENQWPGANGPAPGPEGVGLCKAIKGFAKYSREVMIPGSCGQGVPKDSIACYDSYDKSSPMYTDTSVNNTANRQWMWFLCNEPFEYWQTWGPGSDSGLVSEHFIRDYYLRQCANFFPDVGSFTYGLKKGRTVEQVNAKTGGWDYVNTTRLMWVNGEYDPWRPATVSADLRPGGPLKSTKEAPVWVLPKAAHCNDLIVKNGVANPAVMEVIKAEVAQMKEWVGEFYKQKGVKTTREFHA
ncbi:Thymus-specific serine protease [Tolypocladium paradoxum]|uniref:Thymus-specific serine protease n=1 Tax=Tolypocladium paradoxum TaxID=94208 RepID=A0A2S4KUT2_9HYPO|nr:Thymus-specific serine protease [Tolypocladium paradoxum]